MNAFRYMPACLLSCCLLCRYPALTAQKIYFTGDNTDQAAFDKIPRSATRATRDIADLPDSASIKLFAPVPRNQGNFGTCVAWSTGYAARTISYCIQHQVTNPAQINALSFSPTYLYYYVKTPGDQDCTGGSKIEDALKILGSKGDVPMTTGIPACTGTIDSATDQKARDYSIKTYVSLTNMFKRITNNEVLAIKKEIAEKKPVIFSLVCYKSLFNTGQDGRWTPVPDDSVVGNHAVCIVGYNDNKFGGAFEVMNSWGTDWGNHGFFWITYPQIMQNGSYALELMDREVAQRGLDGASFQPEIKGTLDFVTTDQQGRDLSLMPLSPFPVAGQEKRFYGYRLSNAYPSGQAFKIKFTTNAPAFVYIFSVDENKTVSPLFPYADNISPAVNSTAATIYLPSETKHYSLNADARKEAIAVIYSKSPVDISRLKSGIASGPDMGAALSSLFSRQLIPLSRIRYGTDRISFQADAGENEMICFLINLDHQ